MRGAVNVATTPTEIVPDNAAWTYAYLFNNSDTTIYVQWSAESTALTTSNGIPIPAGADFRIPATDGFERAPIMAIHGGAGTKELRYVVD